MPRVKKTEKEEELDIKKPVRDSVVTRWFKENAGDSAHDLKIVSELTARSCWDQFNLSPTVSGEVYAVIFYATFMTIIDFLMSQRKKYSQYTMEIGQCINIGYMNNTNDDNEKVGSFDPIIEYIGTNTRVQKDNETSITANLNKWKGANVKTEDEIREKIEKATLARLNSDEFKIDTRTDQMIFPIFGTFMDNLVAYVKVKYKEAMGTNVSTVSIDVFRIFRIKYSFNEEENMECIEYEPLTLMKCPMKSDDISKTYVD
jgi:hypothetical protein